MPDTKWIEHLYSMYEITRLRFCLLQNREEEE